MPNVKQSITTPALIDEMRRAIWRDDARRAGVAEADIERHVWLAWRIARAGGVGVVIQGLGRMQPTSVDPARIERREAR